MNELDSNERAVLLGCLASRLNGERAGGFDDLLRLRVDWVKILRAARRHRVLPLLYASAVPLVGASVPGPVVTYLEESYRENAVLSMHLAACLCRLLQAFEARGISAAAWKGPALAVRAYGGVALRMFADLDVLVTRADIAKANDVLVHEGFQPQRAMPDLQVWPFVRSADAVEVELHWAPAPWSFVGNRLDLDRLETERLTIGDVCITHIAPSDLLVLLSVHGAKHRWDALRWIADLAALIGACRLDWERVERVAAESRCQRSLHLGLRLTQDFFNVALPDQIARTVANDVAASRLATIAADGLHRRRPGPPRGAERVRDLIFQLRAKDGAADRLRCAVGVCTGRSWRALTASRYSAL